MASNSEGDFCERSEEEQVRFFQTDVTFVTCTQDGQLLSCLVPAHCAFNIEEGT